MCVIFWGLWNTLMINVARQDYKAIEGRILFTILKDQADVSS